MALSKALIGSQGKIKLQLLYGKSNGQERLLTEKRWALPEGVAVVGEETLRLAHGHSSSGALEELLRILGLIPMHLTAKRSRQLSGVSGKWMREVIIFGSKIFMFGLCRW